ncbi:MAG TPA: hypothetical protein PLS20_03215 [Ruminococcus flavefaciens]|nr:hypothetical protein [Ruminococcus flavefaciens]
MAHDFRFENNAPLVREQFEACRKRALTAIGMQAESYAKLKINQADAIDTGRLINSVTYGTAENAGSHDYSDNEGNHYQDTIGTAEEDAVYIGTNVEYAPYIEFGHKHYYSGTTYAPVHFLKDAAGNHTAEYKDIIKQSMENA